MFLLFLLCFVRLEISKGQDSKLHPLLQDPMKLFQDSPNIILNQKLDNISSMKLSVMTNSSVVNETSSSLLFTTELSTAAVPKLAPRESLIKEMLSRKNYEKLCGQGKPTDVIIKPDNDIFKSNLNVSCSMKSFIFFAVLSHISNADSREKIRQSWGSIRQLQNKKLTIIFFVYSDKTVTEKERITIEKERNDYLDTVLLNEKQSVRTEVDVYLKMIQFIILGCQKSEYFVFINDAMFVNIPTFFEAILTHKDISKPSAQTPSLFLCKVKKNALAMRNKKATWYVTKEEWSEKHYPPYCDFLGGMVLSEEVLRDIWMCSFYAKKLWISDVFLTGVLPQKLEVTVEDFLEDFSTNSMKNHYIEGDMSHNVFLTEGRGYNDHTWRLIFNRSLREL